MKKFAAQNLQMAQATRFVQPWRRESRRWRRRFTPIEWSA